MTQDETLAWLTGAFSAKRLIAIRKALGGPKPELTVYLNGSLEAVGFPEPDSAEAMEGAFKCWLHEGGSSFECVFAKPDKTTQAIGGANQDWVAISLSLDGSTAGFASLGYLYKTNAVTLGSGVVYVPLASAIGLVGLAASATYNESAADQSAVPYSRNPIASEVILKALRNLTVGISVDAQGNVDILGNLQVTQGLTVDGSLNANGSTLNSLSVTNECDIGGPLTMGYGTLLETGTAGASAWDYSGNLTVEGVFKQNTYELDKGITISNLPNNLVSYYAHIRVSNGKLNLVIALYSPSDTVTTEITNPTSLAIVPLPSEILSHLYPYVAPVLDKKRITAGLGNQTGTYQCEIDLSKNTNSLEIYLAYLSAIPSSVTTSRNWRFEFNFILS